MAYCRMTLQDKGQKSSKSSKSKREDRTNASTDVDNNAGNDAGGLLDLNAMFSPPESTNDGQQPPITIGSVVKLDMFGNPIAPEPQPEPEPEIPHDDANPFGDESDEELPSMSHLQMSTSREQFTYTLPDIQFLQRCVCRIVQQPHQAPSSVPSAATAWAAPEMKASPASYTGPDDLPQYQPSGPHVQDLHACMQSYALFWICFHTLFSEMLR